MKYVESVHVNFLVKVSYGRFKTWGIAHINLTGRKLGRHVWGRHTKQRKPMMPLTSVNPVIIQKNILCFMGFMRALILTTLTMDVL